jgi:hypothetical protein
MNLAVEYVLRRGIAKDALELPCSLFLTNIKDEYKRIIVTISWISALNRCNVKQWEVSECYMGNLYPKYRDTMVEKSGLFSSEAVIVPMYQMLPFLEAPYETGTRQSNDRYAASQQEAEYTKTLDNFFNPPLHKKMRRAWLWATFIRTHNIKMEDTQIFKEMKTQLESIEIQYPVVWHKWQKWVELFDPETNIAPELVFHDNYARKIALEEKSLIRCADWHPWSVFEPQPKPKKKKRMTNPWDNRTSSPYGYGYSVCCSPLSSSRPYAMISMTTMPSYYGTAYPTCSSTTTPISSVVTLGGYRAVAAPSTTTTYTNWYAPQ